MLIANHHHWCRLQLLAPNASQRRKVHNASRVLSFQQSRFIWHYEDVVKVTSPPIIHKHVWLQCWEIAVYPFRYYATDGGLIEPPRVLRRLFGLSHAAMAGCSGMA